MQPYSVSYTRQSSNEQSDESSHPSCYLVAMVGSTPGRLGQASPGHQVIASGDALGVSFLDAPPVLLDDGSVLFADIFSQRIYRGNGVTTTVLVQEDTAAPGGGLLSTLNGIEAACSNGDFAVRGRFLLNGVTRDALYAWRSGSFYRLAAEGDSAPGGGTFERFGLPSINRNGSVVFVADLLGGPGAGLYLARINGGNVTVQRIAAAGQAEPGGGLFANMNPSFGAGCAVDDSGRVVFAAERTVGSSGTERYLFSWDGTSTVVVPNSQSVNAWMINNSGQVVFHTYYTLFFGPFNAPTAILRRDDPAPGGGTFGTFDGVHLSANGHVAFYSSYLNLTSGSSFAGVFLWNSSRGVVLISSNNGAAPGGGVFSDSFYTGSPFVTDSGRVYWNAQITSSTWERLYMGDGEVRELVAGDGTSLGATRARYVTFSSTFPLLAGNGPVDNSDRLTYVATDTNYSDFVVRFTPPTGWGVPAEREIVVHQPDGNPMQNGAARSFGTVTTGSSGSLTFSIKNIGKTLLTGILVSIEGTNPADFTVTTSPASFVSGPSGSTVLTVAFSPRAVGSRSAVLRVASNDADENPYLIPLSGTGVSPEIVVEHPVGTSLVSGVASIAFPSTAAGTQSAARVFTIRNTGSVALTINEITNSSGLPGSFLIQTAGMSTTVPPGGSTTFSVTFAPTGAGGARSTTLRIANNDADESVFQIALSGVTTVPDLVIEQPAGSGLASGTSSVNFGVQNGGTAAPPRDLPGA